MLLVYLFEIYVMIDFGPVLDSYYGLKIIEESPNTQFWQQD